MAAMINRLFGYEEINGNGRCPYLHRWCLLVLPRGVRLYLHKFIGSDWSRDLHDHPKRFISIGLWGSYIEETPIVCWNCRGTGRADNSLDVCACGRDPHFHRKRHATGRRGSARSRPSTSTA